MLASILSMFTFAAPCGPSSFVTWSRACFARSVVFVLARVLPKKKDIVSGINVSRRGRGVGRSLQLWCQTEWDGASLRMLPTALGRESECPNKSQMLVLDSSKTRMARLSSKWRFSGMLAGRRTSSSLGCRVVGRGPKEGAHALSRRPGNEWHLPCRRQNNKASRSPEQPSFKDGNLPNQGTRQWG